MSDAQSTPQAAIVRPCVCCREREHKGIPDRDLDGYVCRECAKALAIALRALELSEITGCTPEPPTTPRDEA